MSAIEQIQKTIQALPLEQRVFLAESLPPLGEEMSEAEEMAEVERREKEIQTGKVQPLSDAELWERIESDRAR